MQTSYSPVFKRQHLIMRKTESPVFLVVGRPVGNPVRMSGSVNRCGLSSLNGIVACTGVL